MTCPGMEWKLGAARAAGAAERENRQRAIRQLHVAQALAVVQNDNTQLRRCRVRIVALKETANAS